VNPGSTIPPRFLETVGKPLRNDVLLGEYSSFRIGGKADFFFEAAEGGDLRAAVLFARREGIPFYVIGGGYNVLFADAGYRGVVIRNRTQDVRPGSGPDEFTALSGTPLLKILQYAQDNHLEGLEFLAGIPGTIGGALFSNAGAFGRAIADHFAAAAFLDRSGNERRISLAEMDFGYRRSILQTRHEIALEATLKATPGDPERILARIRENLDRRRLRQPPWGTPCAGSYFKNPILPDGTKIPAGRLLEEAGAKECRVGDAGVFPGHANFLINLGGARAADMLALAAELKDRVRAGSGIVLEEEVIYLPESFSMS
jgi:UDP-N-acetylmuramate dehydrogenase